jgi:hypothetical protein
MAKSRHGGTGTEMSLMCGEEATNAKAKGRHNLSMSINAGPRSGDYRLIPRSPARNRLTYPDVCPNEGWASAALSRRTTPLQSPLRCEAARSDRQMDYPPAPPTASSSRPVSMRVPRRWPETFCACAWSGPCHPPCRSANGRISEPVPTRVDHDAGTPERARRSDRRHDKRPQCPAS